jgi:WD40 repeat protein
LLWCQLHHSDAVIFALCRFSMDSLKFFLSLYGHKLPVLCMDISSDGDLMVTGSMDKNLKIWGLDFGDCHKSIFAHADRCCTLIKLNVKRCFFRICISLIKQF